MTEKAPVVHTRFIKLDRGIGILHCLPDPLPLWLQWVVVHIIELLHECFMVVQINTQRIALPELTPAVLGINGKGMQPDNAFNISISLGIPS